jgi:hypothetical protein|tara:strand:+ start:6 stop:536 length:531 start_codon:yes stop_codon:yes gene_type:complete
MSNAEANVEGAVKVLVDILTANGFTKTRSPYENNFRGLVDAILDLKEGFPTFSPADRIGFNATAFENVTAGDALFMRTSDGQVGKASAANGTLENAIVIGFANTTVTANGTVKVIVAGTITLSGLDAGDLYFLSPTTAGAITLTPPSSAGQAVTRVGEAATTTQFATHIEPPVLLR